MTRIDQSAAVLDPAAILASIGEAAYEWRLDTDALIWSANAAAVLGVEPATVATGRTFAAHVDADAGQSRADAIMVENVVPGAAGVTYQVQYAFKSAGGEKIWLEDSGRWFAGADGRRS